ncbi:carboxylesterase, LipT domain protein [Mycobacterium ulcerans str. Harvey]|uniref:Carboxylesterase, LipT domain protein n=1 Tax=Mycobacterium ulcerans str. Harvey TaxID=1299332 RepID=A0ABN0QYW4_MYCUL|nr:carboxylesterase, LipT domain protein [Mycobacterium ulcerans str. Harvey]
MPTARARKHDAASALMRATAAQLVQTQHRLIDQGMQKRLAPSQSPNLR